MTSTNSLPVSLRGILPSTADCNGPSISQDRGMDAMCCAKCHILRQQIYQQKGVFIGNSFSIDYVLRLMEIQRDVLTACIIIACGEPVMYIPPARNELHQDNVKGMLKEQFLLWKDLHIIDNIDKRNIGFSHSGIPFIFPSEGCVRKEQFGGDEGVEIIDDKLKVINPKKAFASGKWNYLINYYTVLNLLYNNKEEMIIF
jgi:hypothetical protein